jgi:hypothetical protein
MAANQTDFGSYRFISSTVAAEKGSDLMQLQPVLKLVIKTHFFLQEGTTALFRPLLESIDELQLARSQLLLHHQNLAPCRQCCGFTGPTDHGKVRVDHASAKYLADSNITWKNLELLQSLYGLRKYRQYPLQKVLHTQM